MDWAALGALLDKYGFDTVVIIGIAWFFLKEAWPLAKESVKDMREQLAAQTKALEQIAKTIVDISVEQKEIISENIETSKKIISEIRKGRNDVRK